MTTQPSASAVTISDELRSLVINAEYDGATRKNPCWDQVILNADTWGKIKAQVLHLTALRSAPAPEWKVTDEMVEAFKAEFAKGLGLMMPSSEFTRRCLTVALALTPAGGGEVVAGRGEQRTICEACGNSNLAHDRAVWTDDGSAFCPGCSPPAAPSKVVEAGANLDDLLAEMRGNGWSVAVHNDYKLGGVGHTFWLFTHPNGRWVKGEGLSDYAAVLAALGEAP